MRLASAIALGYAKDSDAVIYSNSIEVLLQCELF